MSLPCPIHCLFPISSWPTEPTLLSRQDRINQIYFSSFYRYHDTSLRSNMLPYQKAEYLGTASFSELDSTVYNNSIFLIGLATKFSTNLEGLLHFSPQASLQSPPSILTPTVAIQPIREGVLWGLTLFKSLSLHPQSMDWDNSTLNHWILITQT